MKRSRSLILLLVLALLGANVLAQDGNKKATKSETDKTVQKLQQKVLLTDDQAAKVKAILASYTDGDKSSENLVEAQRRIEALFDEKQKAKYEIIKDDWWKSVNKISKE